MLGNLFTSRKNDMPGMNQPAGVTPVMQTSGQTTQQTTQTVSSTGPVLVAPVLPVSTYQQTTTTTTTPPPPPPVSSPSVAAPSMDPSRREDLSALSHLDSRSSQVLAHAQQETMRIKQQYIKPEQILFGLLYDEEIYKLCEQFSVDVAKLSREVQSKEQLGTYTGQPTLGDEVKQIFEQAFKNAKDRTSTFIAPEDILVCMFATSMPTATLLQAQGMQRDQVVEKLAKTTSYSEGRKSVLDKYGIDLTAKAREGSLDPVAGREKEVDRLVHILLRRTKNNPIIIGEAGVGKTAVIEGLAQQIVAGTVPKDLQNKRIIQIDVASLVAGASHRGEFEERLRSVIHDAMASTGKVILFIDEIHALIGTGDNEGGMDASNILKPNLARGQLQIIGTTTTSEYRKYFEKDKAFARRFQPILCEEPNEDNAFKMMQVLKTKYEKFHSVVIPDDALKAAVQLSKKYIGERYLPDKAVDLLDEASAEVKLQHNEGKRQDNTVAKSDIEKVVSAWTGIPITKLTEDESAKLLELEDRIHKRLIDQINAVSAVSEAVRRGRIGLAAANRPIASFIFLGPTGTGKTELAKTLAEILFGRDDAMIRLDMSEYMEKHEVAKLIGAPPGYVGYEEGGQLTEAVRAKPYSIVLFDEVEKAHPDVFNILLQLLEDGRLTDNKGNTISFKNTIVIATSNIGSQAIQDELSKPTKTPEEFAKMYQEMQTRVSEELHKFFRPELLNRFDDIVMFSPLRQEDMKFIAKLGIEKTGKLLKDQGFSLETTDAALEQMAKDGYDQQYGARPLRRLIQSSIENPIAMLIINKTFVQGDTILIDFDAQKGEFTFLKKAPQPDQSATPGQPQIDQGGVAVQPGIPIPPVPPTPPGTGAVQEVPTVPLQQVVDPNAQAVDTALQAVQTMQGPSPSMPPAPAPLPEAPSLGVLTPVQPTMPTLSSIAAVDQMPQLPLTNAVPAGSTYGPPAVAVANLLDEEPHTDEFA